MSRLDDELRNAFKRESPPADFTDRLLARLSQAPPPKLSWWQKLAMLLEPPKLRWVAIGVTASLLLAIGAVQFSRLNHGVVNDNGANASTNPGPEPDNSGSVTPAKDHSQPNMVATTTPAPSQAGKHLVPSSINHRLAHAYHQEQQALRAEGEAAKEKLLLALSIASSALSDAQRAVQDDSLTP